MKRFILIIGLLSSGFSFGADWKFAAVGANGDRMYVDSSQYNYNKKTNTIAAWFEIVKYKNSEGDETYVDSKYLFQFSCLDKKSKLLAYVNYNTNGEVISSDSRDGKNVKFNIIIPDSVGEDLWKVACTSRGNGFRYPKYQLGERVSKQDMQSTYNQ